MLYLTVSLFGLCTQNESVKEDQVMLSITINKNNHGKNLQPSSSIPSWWLTVQDKNIYRSHNHWEFFHFFFLIQLRWKSFFEHNTKCSSVKRDKNTSLQEFRNQKRSLQNKDRKLLPSSIKSASEVSFLVTSIVYIGNRPHSLSLITCPRPTAIT